MNKDLIYLDSYVIQKDMRIRLPKSVLANMNAEKGETVLDIFFDKNQKALVMKLSDEQKEKYGK